MEPFSTPFFEENFRQYIQKNRDVFSKLEAMNSYYRSVVSSMIYDNLNKNSEIVRRIRNLDSAYKTIKQENTEA
ncbi:protein YvfG [Guptibacillus hwajinpoensis]|uniref:protein YvfG n=1 Tax=Guptibacillus hwajinpoensis TaxID=208199 RepID=UPI001CFDBD6C|nr:protein YvfG [Pseudalkalibacillus hwajinpoensis]WLR58412.1 protein YvfG [Pseudalkalibacillus hwajinpoensis]